MKRAILVVLLLFAARADAHVGSPDVFFEGEAGPYKLFVAITMPQVIPGVASIQIRSESTDVTAISVVPMRLTGPGSELPPTPDAAQRVVDDPSTFTADLWLMERGSLQVRVAATGARGEGTLRVPVPASALTVRAMDRGLGTLLFALMLLLASALVTIAAAAVREVALDPDAAPDARAKRRGRIALVCAGAGVLGLLALGNAWWNAEASDYAQMVQKPWHIEPKLDGCRLAIPKLQANVLPDHGHAMHLFLVRGELDALAHLHPTRDDAGDFTTALPSLPAGTYRVFADVVLESGFPVTGTATLELPALACPPVGGDDSTWAGRGDTARSPLGDGLVMEWQRPAELRAGVAAPLRFRVVDATGAPVALEAYMGMAGHAEIVKTDGAVFAHIHPSGSVAMPALALAQGGAMAAMPGMDGMPADMAMPTSFPPDVAFPFGFPRAGDYRIFVQVKLRGRVATGAFDARVQ